MPMQNIDALQQKKDDISSSLENLKTLTEQQEKERVQKEIVREIQTIDYINDLL